jgi:2-polyprenyl-3-methyl-5-hydroxy-6-metoxy-1,4-benzoquinol methylase
METSIFPCDICGSEDATEIVEGRLYNDGTPIHVCCSCGFVYCRERRSAQAIADSWSNDIYGAADGDEEGHGELDPGAMVNYSALTPYVKARHGFVLEMISRNIGLKDRTLCDIGAGQGEFLDAARREYGASVFGVEPSGKNCSRLAAKGIDHFNGIIEDYEVPASGKFDVATIVWTLENCQSCRNMVQAANAAVKDGGHLVIATGSRILVPFKKPLHYFFNPEMPQDTHPFFISYNCLKGLMATCGFEMIEVNRFIDSDYLVMIGRKTDRDLSNEWEKDDYRKVIDFFNRWHEDTSKFYMDQ